MILTIKNAEALREWMGKRHNHRLVSIQDAPPHGAMYEDGDLIARPVNVAWKDTVTGEVFDIEYELGDDDASSS